MRANLSPVAFRINGEHRYSMWPLFISSVGLNILKIDKFLNDVIRIYFWFVMATYLAVVYKYPVSEGAFSAVHH